MQCNELAQVVRNHNLRETAGHRHNLRPGRRLQVLLIGVVRGLGVCGVEGGAQLTHKCDFFVGPQTDTEVLLWLVGVAEVIEEHVKDMVQVLES